MASVMMAQKNILAALGLVLLMQGWASGTDPYDYMTGFCAIGERAPGSTGHKKAMDYIVAHLDTAVIDSFYAHGTWFYNIYRKMNAAGQRIGIGAHWDSDPDCPGANDGGSGVAVLLKLADTISRDPPDYPVDIMFFDGEDVGKAELLGSTHFAAKCLENYAFIIILDMIGDRDLQIFQEGFSTKFFPELVDSIWRIAVETAPHIFVPMVKHYVIDDHMSLIKYGIQAIDIIDFDYPYWDTADDTIDKCSKQSLDVICKFALRLIYPENRP
jgi:hypothetical protein